MEKRIDVVVLAGDGAASQPVYGKNKAFLEMRGLPLFLHTVNALQQTETIRNIHVVGPLDRLEEQVRKHSDSIRSEKPLRLHQQQQHMFDNAFATFLQTIDGYVPGGEKTNKEWYNKAVLFVSADTPVLIHHEIDYFIDHCDMEKFDFFSGVTEEKHLRYYYPAEDKPGIKFAYFFFREGTYRMNNLFLVTPFRVTSLIHVQAVYNCRHQKRFTDVIGLAIYLLFKVTGLRPVFFYGLMRLALFFEMVHVKPLVLLVKKLLILGKLEREIGKIIGCRFAIVETPHGGAALDIDRESDFDIINEMYDDWVAHQNQIGSYEL